MSLTMCLSPGTREMPRNGTPRHNFRAVVGIPQSSPKSTQPSKSTTGSETNSWSASILDETPVEVFVEIFKHLGLKGAFNLAATNRRFAAIFATHKTSILLPIVEVEFSPFSGLLQVVKASHEDLYVPYGTWLDKRIRTKNAVLCEGGKLPDDTAGNLFGTRCKDVVLESRDMDRILEICKVVKGWERIFPQHRFHASPLATRSLEPQENERLRRALYAWMRYAYYFHGDLPRPNLYEPAGNDPRVNQLRAMSNTELRGLRDLWLTVEDIVELKLCPAVDHIRIGSDYDVPDKVAACIGWGEQRENQVVVATVCKLSPAEMLHYLDNLHEYPKTKLIRAIRQSHPRFESDTQSLGSALECVTFERYRRAETQFPSAVALWLPMYSRAFGEGHGGILDWGSTEAEEECAKMGEMTGLNLSWRSDEAFIHRRPEIPPGLLDV